MLPNSILSGPIAALAAAFLAVTAVAQTPVPRPVPAPVPAPASGAAAPASTPSALTPPPAAPAVPAPAAPGVKAPAAVAPVPAPGPSAAPIPGLTQPGGAQRPVIPLPGGTTLPQRPAPTNTFGPNGNVSASGERMIRLDFPNSDVRDVLNYYQQLTEKRLIFNAQLVGNVVINAMEVPKSEAIKIIELSLQMNGVFIEPVDGEPNIMRVSPMNQSPRPLGIPFIDSEEALATVPQVSEQVVMYLMKLTYLDPTEMAQFITSGLLSQNPASYSSVFPLPKANAILITDTVPFVRNIISFVKQADVEPPKVESVFITLQHAQAEDVVANLEKLFEKTQTTTTTTTTAVAPTPQGGRFRNGGPGGAPGGANPGNAIGGAPTGGADVAVEISGGIGTGPTEDNIIIGKVKLAADKRTNRIHIVSRPVNMEFIKMLINEYDADVPLPEPAVRALRYRAVDEVLDAVAAAIRDPGDINGSNGGAGGAALGQNGARPGTGANQAGGAGANANRNLGGANLGGAYTGGGSSDTAGALGESLTTTERPTQPTYLQVGKSTIIADPFSNTIVTVGTSDVKQKVLKLLDQLDSPQPQVMIEVVIGELKLQRDENYGLDYILKNGPALNNTNNPISGGTGTGGATTTTGVVGFNDAGSPVLNLNGLLNQQAISKIATAGGNGFAGYFTNGNSFQAVVNLLESSDRFRVITKPRVFTSSNKRAIITSGEEVPVPTNITSGFGGTNGNTLQTNSSIQFKPIELRLEVLPLINSEREVQLEIVQNVSERAGSTLIDNNQIPNVSRRAIKTYVTVPNKATLILGGLIKESQDVTRAGVPLLSQIPVLGPLFGHTVKNKTRTELVILMRPIVTMNSPENAKLREKAFEDFTIPPDIDQALFPIGMREKAVVPKVVAAPRETAPTLRVDATTPPKSTTTTTTVTPTKTKRR